MLRHLMASLGAVYVTPGPFSIFKKQVFDKLGGYRKAHNTEDMELAVRMQKANMKISNAYEASIYTKAPSNFKALFKQRLRWTYGFLMNAKDNKDIYFNPKYGNLGMIVFPTATLSIFSSIFLLFSTVYNWIVDGLNKVSELITVGFNPNWSIHFDPFYINTNIITIISLIALIGTCTMLLFSRRMSEGNMKIGIDVFYFLGLYALIAPIWMSKALYNVAFSKKTSWR
jgi:cellulose synthase/poly-beta-1,6-N-acetylglucosamine synthase-like glycosyltransferase